jgi:DNA polymerase III alpha subunit
MSIQFSKIRSIKPIGTLPTIDLEVDHPDHNFYCEGLVTSNSHSLSYATLAAQTVLVKYKYPQQFFTAVLKMAQYDPEPLLQVGIAHEELVDFGIQLLPPSLKTSKMDFSIEGRNIRYGLSSIKGVSSKTLEALVEFRGHEFANKIEVFSAAKECGISITVLGALIQAGAMGFEGCRTRMVLEAQAFNLLTEREKRNMSKICDSFDGDLLDGIAAVVEKQTLADDNKPIIKPSRFETFKKNFANYRAMYRQNKKHEKLAEWYYESQLLGYSHSKSLVECFEDRCGFLEPLRLLGDLPDRASFTSVALVTDLVRSKSKAGNKMMRMNLTDCDGSATMIFMDNARGAKLTEFSKDNNVKKGDIIQVKAAKSNDTFFVEAVTVIETPVFMKVGDVKKK